MFISHTVLQHMNYQLFNCAVIILCSGCGDRDRCITSLFSCDYSSTADCHLIFRTGFISDLSLSACLDLCRFSYCKVCLINGDCQVLGCFVNFKLSCDFSCVFSCSGDCNRCCSCIDVIRITYRVVATFYQCNSSIFHSHIRCLFCSVIRIRVLG